MLLSYPPNVSSSLPSIHAPPTIVTVAFFSRHYSTLSMFNEKPQYIVSLDFTWFIHEITRLSFVCLRGPYLHLAESTFVERCGVDSHLSTPVVNLVCRCLCPCIPNNARRPAYLLYYLNLAPHQASRRTRLAGGSRGQELSQNVRHDEFNVLFTVVVQELLPAEPAKIAS